MNKFIPLMVLALAAVAVAQYGAPPPMPSYGRAPSYSPSIPMRPPYGGFSPMPSYGGGASFGGAGALGDEGFGGGAISGGSRYSAPPPMPSYSGAGSYGGPSVPMISPMPSYGGAHSGMGGGTGFFDASIGLGLGGQYGRSYGKK